MKEIKINDSKLSNPYLNTHLKFEKSIVQILTTSQEANYDEPWSGTSLSSCSGSGFVIAHGDKKYVLTNAHCVENATFVRVRLANDRMKKYKATRKCVSYQCDLALLEVDDPEFLELAKPAELGEMVVTGQPVLTAGFPMGGSELSIAEGITSRIEVRDYVMSGLDMLQVQVSAAINSGNSGGPVFSDDKVVGMAFQGYALHGLGYIIPIPIINHFLKEALSNKPYQGFPTLPIEIQTLQNEALRKNYHMKPDQTGVRVQKIKNCSSEAYKKLKPENKLLEDDILLEIDSMQITNAGTVDVPDVGKCLDFCHVSHMKFIGDTVNVKVLRKENNVPVIRDIQIVLDHIPGQAAKVPPMEHDKMPTYFVSSGISFMPLTDNYLDGKGSDLLEHYYVEDGTNIASVPKRNPDDQIIVINEIFDCEQTEGYESYINAIVKEINGKIINNIRDVIDAIEANKEPFHVIITSGRSKLVVKNMSKEENAALLKMYNIPKDRSEDLGKGQVVVHSSESKEVAATSSSSSSSHDSFFNSSSRRSSKRKIQPLSLEDESSTPKEFKDKKDELTLNDLPGYKKFQAKISEMEEKYKNLPDDDEDDEDYALDDNEEVSDEERSENSEEESASQNIEESQEETENANKQNAKNSRRLIKLSEKPGLFQKRKRDEDDDDQCQSKKRKLR